MLDNDVRTMRADQLPSASKEQIEAQAREYGYGGVPPHVWQIIDRCSGNSVREVHNQLSLEGKMAHALMLHAAYQGRNVIYYGRDDRDFMIPKANISVRDVVRAYPELQPYYAAPADRRTPYQDQVADLAFKGSIDNTMSYALPEEVRCHVIKAAIGDISLEEMRKVIPDYITEGSGSELSRGDREGYIKHFILLMKPDLGESSASVIASRVMDAAEQQRDIFGTAGE